MDNLLKVMEKLRAPDGCPWDREQTHQSLKTNLVEEAYEVVDAIDSGEDSPLCEELGDLLLQIAFHCVIAQESGRFNYDQVEKGICDKLVSRHSHIFGNDTAKNADEVLKLWQANKRKEKGQPTMTKAMEDIPASFPALMESYKVLDKAASVGYGSKTTTEAFDNLETQSHLVKKEIQEENPSDMETLIGSLLFSLVDVCRLLKIDPEIALHKTVKNFKNRFSLLEKQWLEDKEKGQGKGQ